MVTATNKRLEKRRSLPALALLLAGSALLAIAPASHAQAQSRTSTERAEQIERSLKPAAPARRDNAAYTNRIIQMEIPQPSGEDVTVVLNYNHSVDLAVYYDFDSAEITSETAELLNDLGYALASPGLAGSRYLVAGHTDASGSKAYNLDLSRRRAEEAKYFLVENFDLDPSRLIVVGFGESRPADTKRPYDGINRRVEITLIEDAMPSGPVGYSTEPGNDRRTPSLARSPVESSSSARDEVASDEPPRPAECRDVDAASDPRPAVTGLDDFGGRRTPVLCGPTNAAADGSGAVVTTPDGTKAVLMPRADDLEDPGRGSESDAVQDALPADGQNSAITN